MNNDNLQNELDLNSLECENSSCYDSIEIMGKYTVTIKLNNKYKTKYTISLCGEGCQNDILESFMKEYH